jgi:NAD(P)-dependent dehydrogenase (short-subunit alcohol dehydrogenase family)
VNVDGRAALVTGGAAGIGSAVAADLRAAGEQVLTAVREPHADVVVDLAVPGAAGRMGRRSSGSAVSTCS